MSVEQNSSNPDLDALNDLMRESPNMTAEEAAYLEELRGEFEPQATVAQLSAAEVGDRNAAAERQQKDALAIGKYVMVGDQRVMMNPRDHEGVMFRDPA